MKILILIASVILVLNLVLNILRFLFGWGMDSTDKSSFNRSGFSVYTDNATKVQYLRVGGIFGSTLTPRLDLDGKPYTE